MTEGRPSPWLRILLVLAVLGAGAGTGAYALRSFSQTDVPAPAGPASDDGPVVACSGRVDVEDGVVALAPIQPGRVDRVLVRETAPVSAGMVLLHVEDELYRLQLKESGAAVEAARVQLAQARVVARQHKARLAQQQAAAEAAGHRAASARHVLAEKQELRKLKLIGTYDLEAAGEQVKEQEATARAEHERLTELQQDDPALAVRKAEADLSLAEARQQQARRNLEECDLKAPRAGTVLRILAGPGDLVGGPGRQAAVLFCPQQPRVVRAEVEQEFASRLAVGQPATVEDEARPELTWPGRVLRVSDWYAERRPVLHDPSQFNDVQTVECLVSLEGERPPPRIGQRVRVKIGRR